MHFFKFFFMPAVLIVFCGGARAEIIWEKPFEPGGYHQNLNFEDHDNLHRADVRKLQKSLAARGFYKGRIDGIWGGMTTQAILDYQAVQQMPLTGTVTIATLNELGVYPDRKTYR